MEPFRIYLRNEKVKQYNRIALLIVVIHFALFGYMAVALPAGDLRNYSGASALLLGILLALKNIPFFKKTEHDFYYYSIAELIIIVTWIGTGYWWFVVLTGLISTLYVIARRPLIVLIRKEHVQYPSFPSKKISWSALDSLLLKDGLLTIDFKNDRLVQQPVETDISSRQEQEINEFCRQQLNT